MENIIFGVTSAINAYFNGNIKVYTDTVKQGFSKPCFIVIPQKSAVERISIGRFKKTLTVKVIYYPQSVSKNDEMESAAFSLCSALRIIKWNEDLYIAKNTKWEAEKDKLTFFADFDSILYWNPNASDNSFDEDFNDDADLMMKLDFICQNP